MNVLSLRSLGQSSPTDEIFICVPTEGANPRNFLNCFPPVICWPLTLFPRLSFLGFFLLFYFLFPPLGQVKALLRGD